jgi:hypothetical protein
MSEPQPKTVNIGGEDCDCSCNCAGKCGGKCNCSPEECACKRH